MTLARIRIRIVIPVLVALALAIFGVSRLVVSLTADPEPAQVGSLDSVTAEVTTVGWVDMDHDMSANAQGYQMPPQMMPGMPEEGKERLAVSVTVINTANDTRPVRPIEEFALHATKDGELIPPHSDSFGELPRLAPHNAVKGVLFFDLPPGDVVDSASWLEWRHGDSKARILVPLNGAGSGPEHHHNP
jgi:hypothetical protein